MVSDVGEAVGHSLGRAVCGMCEYAMQVKWQGGEGLPPPICSARYLRSGAELLMSQNLKTALSSCGFGLVNAGSRDGDGCTYDLVFLGCPLHHVGGWGSC